MRRLHKLVVLVRQVLRLWCGSLRSEGVGAERFGGAEPALVNGVPKASGDGAFAGLVLFVAVVNKVAAAGDARRDSFDEVVDSEGFAGGPDALDIIFPCFDVECAIHYVDALVEKEALGFELLDVVDLFAGEDEAGRVLGVAGPEGEFAAG